MVERNQRPGKYCQDCCKLETIRGNNRIIYFLHLKYDSTSGILLLFINGSSAATTTTAAPPGIITFIYLRQERAASVA